MKKPWLWFLAIALVAGAPAGWFVTDHLESDNAFCTSCHLDAETALHRDNAKDFASRPAVSLAVAHAVAGNDGRDDGAFRCIDCHGGTGFVGRARVKLLSAKDAFWYLTGRFEEPEGMHWPLQDADCRGCHARFDERVVEAGGGDPKFHELAVHNQKLGVSCVTCHLSHEREVLRDFHMLQPAVVRAQCAQCHPEFEEDPS